VFVHFTVVIYQINAMGSKFVPLPEELIAMSRAQVGKGLFQEHAGNDTPAAAIAFLETRSNYPQHKGCKKNGR
jgi:hypothetical protein